MNVKFSIVLLLLILYVIPLKAQEEKFSVYKKDTTVILNRDSTVFLFGQYKKSKKAIKERTVVSNNGSHYRFLVIEDKRGKIQQLVDSAGELKGSVLLYDKSKYDLLLPTGERFLYKYEKGFWSYELEGKEIIKADTRKCPVGEFILTCFDSTYCNADVVKIAFLERCSYNTISKSAESLGNASFILRTLLLLR